MERKPLYSVEITKDAEIYYYEVLEYFYEHCSINSADRKSEELLEFAISLEKNPTRGRIVEKLSNLEKDHRYILYYYTQTKAIKIIYFIDELEKIVYITDFFPCESNEKKIEERS